VRTTLLAVLLLSASISAQELRTVPLFRHGIIADSVGIANLPVADVDGDGLPEVISCSAGAPFALGMRNGAYATKWHGAAAGCVAVAAGDRDGDGGMDVVTVSSSENVARLHIYDPRHDGGPAQSLTLPANNAADVAVANVDFDGGNEIIVVTSGATYIYDGATLALQWTATGYGGTDVGIGDVDGDTRLEIVVDGSSGSVLDGGTNVVKWGYVGGFGRMMTVGNVDGDAKAEIVYAPSYSGITILNGDTFTTSSITAPDGVQSLGIADLNHDSANEILVGNDQWGDIVGLRPTDGFQLWSIGNPEHGGFAVAGGDIDGDGIREVIWTAGMSSSGDDALFIANVTTKVVEYRSTDLDGYFMTATADVDNDGRNEVVVATYASESGYSGTILEIFDARTGASEGILPMGGHYDLNASRIAIGQLDNDAALEIVALGEDWYDPTMISWDGVTHAVEWTLQMDGFGGPSFIPDILEVANVDGDPVDEILIAMTDNKVQVLHGASNIIQKSLVLPSNANDLALADLDGNAVLDLVVLSGNTLAAYETALWTSIGSTTVSNATEIAATAGRVAALTYNGLSTFTGASFTPAWSCTMQNLSAVSFGTIAGTGYVFTGDGAGTLRAHTLPGSSCPTPMTKSVASYYINDIKVADATNDGRADLLISTYESSAVYHVGLSTESFDDVDALVDYVFGKTTGLSTAADANADQRIGVDDAFLLLDAESQTGAHTLSIGSVAAPAGTRVSLPVTLGTITPANLHALAFRVTISPAAAASNITFTRAGTLATLPPLYERSAATSSSLGYLATFAEPIAAGRIGTIQLTLAASQSTSAITITLDPITTAAGNETQYNHKLQLGSAAIGIGGTPTSTILSSSANPSTVGQLVTFTATVSPITTGTVAFYDNTTLLGHAALTSGQAAISTSALSQGTHSITAVFEGTGSHQGSTSPTLLQNVNAPSIAAPTNVVANATSTTSIAITWNAVTGAASYEVRRSTDGANYTLAGMTSSTFFNDTSRNPSTTYLYRVRALASGGAPSPDSAVDAATTIIFTTGPTVQLAHLTELRTAVNAFRTAAGLANASFTDPSPTTGLRIKAVHVTELRTALNSARAIIGLPALSYTDTNITPGSTLVKAAHVAELRSGVQ
jgi:hypothetical protein